MPILSKWSDLDHPISDIIYASYEKFSRLRVCRNNLIPCLMTLFIASSYRSWSSRWFSWSFQAIRARCSSASCLARSSAREPVSSSYFFLNTSSLNSSLPSTQGTHGYFTHKKKKKNLQLMVRETCHISGQMFIDVLGNDLLPSL